MLSWLQKLFVSNDDDDEEQVQEQSSFLQSQHLRIVIAMAVVFVSAMVMWWILE